MDDETDRYVVPLRDFSAGVTPLDEFHRWLVDILISDGPIIGPSVSGELAATISFISECAMYLDMVTDVDDPNFDEVEARRLAGAFCAIIVQLEDPDLRSAAAHLARWAPRTAARVRGYLAGSLTRPAFERAISRRPWPEVHRAALKQLSREHLAMVAEGLEINDYSKVLRAFA